jgi:thiamine-monophosphate kinase
MAGQGDNTEFSVLETLFRPLAGLSLEARGLLDDVAVLPPQPGFDLVVTTDAMVEGVHFLPDDPLDQVAQKLIRVNLSDLAAKGAVPYGYQLMTAWPRGLSLAAKTQFVAGLRRDQDHFKLSLFGGDTVSTPGPLTLCATLFGHVPAGRTLSRAGAGEGEALLVSGPIGDGYLGLKALQGDLAGLNETDRQALIEAYRRPKPRLDLAAIVLEHATASMDISDGLIADARHMARASGVDMHIALDQVPMSLAGSRALSLGVDSLSLVTGGDDYQILCTASARHEAALIAGGFVRIGECVRGAGDVHVISAGRVLEVAKAGYVHGDNS